MTLIKPLFLIALVVVGAGGAAAQNSPAPLRLSLEDALQQAAHSNFSLRSASASVDQALAEHTGSSAAFLPRLIFSERGIKTNDPLNAFGFKLKQGIVDQADFAPAVLNNPAEVVNFRTSIELHQPVLDPQGLMSRRSAQYRLKSARKSRAWADRQVEYRVKEAYFGVELALRRVGVLKSALAAAQANRDRAADLFDQGLINRADLLGSEVRVLNLKSQADQAEADRKNAIDHLRYLLGIEEPVQIITTDSLELAGAVVTSLDVHSVNERRSDMEARRYQVRAAKQHLLAERSKFLPRLSVFGGYQWNDDSLFGTNADSWQAGFSLTWNLFNGLANVGAAQMAGAKLKTAELALQNQTLLNNVEIQSALRNLKSSRTRLQQAERAVDHARESLKIRADRYREGLEHTTDLLDAEVMLAEQRLSYLNALYAHNMNVYRLELLTESQLTN